MVPQPTQNKCRSLYLTRPPLLSVWHQNHLCHYLTSAARSFHHSPSQDNIHLRSLTSFLPYSSQKSEQWRHLLPPLLHIGPIPNPPRTVGHFSCLFILLKVFKNLYIEPYKTYFPTFKVTSVFLPLAYLCDMRYNLGIFQDST